MSPTSAGILAYRRVAEDALEVFIAHPGGPFWANKDQGAWTIPKGLVEEDENMLQGAIREFAEETGFSLYGEFLELGFVVQRSGKTVYGWAIEAPDLDPTKVVSNTCRTIWPPRSGDWIEIPEVDRCAWVSPEEAMEKLNPAQAEFVLRLQRGLGS